MGIISQPRYVNGEPPILTNGKYNDEYWYPKLSGPARALWLSAITTWANGLPWSDDDRRVAMRYAIKHSLHSAILLRGTRPPYQLHGAINVRRIERRGELMADLPPALRPTEWVLTRIATSCPCDGRPVAGTRIVEGAEWKLCAQHIRVVEDAQESAQAPAVAGYPSLTAYLQGEAARWAANPANIVVGL